LLLLVLALLPVDSRLRCAEVCRGWRTAVEDHSLWLRLDLSRTSGVGCAVTDTLLRAAVARAAGSLQALDLTGCNKKRLLEFAAVMAAVTANARALREVRLCDFRYEDDTEALAPELISALLAVATQLRVLDVEALVSMGGDSGPMLRGEPPFGPLRLRRVFLSLEDGFDDDLIARVADVASHPWTTEFELWNAPLGNPAALDAVVDLALGRCFTAVALCYCSLSPASAPALARLLGSTALTKLDLTGNGQYGPQLLEGADAVAQLAAALRANSTLQSVSLNRLYLWAHPGAATILLCALMNHPSVRELSLSGNEVDGESRAVAAALLSALLASTPLRLLNLQVCNLRDDGLGPLVDALARNTHLTHLDIVCNSRSTAFLRERLLPAVRASCSLRELNAGEMISGGIAAVMEDLELQDEATALLAARAAADAAGAAQAA
jgi:hypothetical protein